MSTNHFRPLIDVTPVCKMSSAIFGHHNLTASPPGRLSLANRDGGESGGGESGGGMKGEDGERWSPHRLV